MRICVMTGATHAFVQLHKSHWTPPRQQSFTRGVAASHLVSPSRLQVARQLYILEVKSFIYVTGAVLYVTVA